MGSLLLSCGRTGCLHSAQAVWNMETRGAHIYRPLARCPRGLTPRPQRGWAGGRGPEWAMVPEPAPLGVGGLGTLSLGGEEAPQSFRKLGGLVVWAPPTPAGPAKYELGL